MNLPCDTFTINGYHVRRYKHDNGYSLAILMNGQWHEAPIMPTWTLREMEEAVDYQEQRMCPGLNTWGGQHLSQFA